MTGKSDDDAYDKDGQETSRGDEDDAGHRKTVRRRVELLRSDERNTKTAPLG